MDCGGLSGVVCVYVLVVSFMFRLGWLGFVYVFGFGVVGVMDIVVKKILFMVVVLVLLVCWGV